MKERILGLAVYWGVWLILPVLVDGVNALVQVILVILGRVRARRHPVPRTANWRGVSVIIPVYNGEGTLGACLESLCRQNYPSQLIEVLVVDNGSTDRTAQVFQEQRRHPFSGQMHWLSISGRGKAYALNAGLYLASNPYICNVDADTVIHPDALREMVRHFEADPRLAAATGAIEVLPMPVADRQNRTAYLISECEFLEYLAAFWLGRQGQTENQSLYTLAGAFSFFRREIVLHTMLYDNQTVSEDTKVTFDVRQQEGGKRLACIPGAIVYVTPTPSLSALYAQRVRWQRGELEVAALHQEILDLNMLRLRGLALGRTLLIDHTFLFPRLVWTFLFPALVLFGYPSSLIVSAAIAIYIFYVALDIISMLAVYLVATPSIRARLRRTWSIVALIPLYRYLIFGFRLAGSLIALTEPAEWRVRAPWVETRRAVRAWAETLAFWRKANGVRNVQDPDRR